MLEKYIEYLESKLTKKLLEDGTIIFSLGEKRVIELYKPLSIEQIARLELRISEYAEAYKRGVVYFPTEYAQFLNEVNGLNCFHSAFSLGGMQTLDRTNFELNSPFDLMDDNNIRPLAIPKEFIGIGGYGTNSSKIYLDTDGKVYVYDGDVEKLLLKRGGYKKYLAAEVKLLATFKSLNEFLMKETKRLLELYLENPWDAFNKGKRTLPNTELI